MPKKNQNNTQSQKKLTIKEMTDKIASKPMIHKFDYEGIEIEVKEQVPMSVMIGMATSIYAQVFDENMKKYYPQVFEYAYLSTVIINYTNLKIPKDYDLGYQILHSGNLKEEILKRINQEQLKEIRDVALDLIEYQKNMNMSAGRALDAIAEGLNDFAIVIKELKEALGDQDMGEFLVNTLSPEKLN